MLVLALFLILAGVAIVAVTAVTSEGAAVIAQQEMAALLIFGLGMLSALLIVGGAALIRTSRRRGAVRRRDRATVSDLSEKIMQFERGQELQHSAHRDGVEARVAAGHRARLRPRHH